MKNRCNRTGLATGWRNETGIWIAAALLAAVTLFTGLTSVYADGPGQSITVLSDGSSEMLLEYEGAGGQDVYVSVPADWNITSATMQISGSASTMRKTDQKNEATRYEGTWGVRAQQFQPSAGTLTSVELFLAHTSSKPGELTVEIRQDDGAGYPSDQVLASVTRPVGTGGYRWEEFLLPETALEPGRKYWIVTYVGSLGKVAYPAVPSLGDYGYYLGMSLNENYPAGDSADFLTSPGTASWEKYASRKGWDLLFRTNTVDRHFPTEVSVVVGKLDSSPWQYSGELRGPAVVDFSPQINAYMLEQRDTAAEGWITVPLTIGSGSPGVIEISDTRIVKRETAPTISVPTTAPTAPAPTAPATMAAVEPTATPDLQPTAAPEPGSSSAPIPDRPVDRPSRPVGLPEPEGAAATDGSPISLSRPAFVPPSDITLKSLGYGDNTVQGVAVSTDLYFPGSGGYPLADGNYLKLFFSHSEVLLGDRSMMSVRLNGVPLTDLRLTSANAGRTELSLALPRDRILDTVNQIKLLFYMRIMDGICTDELNNPALNATIYSDSYVHYEYASLVRKKDVPAPNLSSYPVPFIRPGYPWPDEVYFVLPDNPSATELTMAASIAAKLGQLSKGKTVTTTLAMLSQLDQEAKQSHNFIFVGKAGSLDLPPDLRKAASLDIATSETESASVTLEGKPIPPDHGILKETLSPWNPLQAVLIVTGATDLAVQRAGTMLTGKTYIDSLSGYQIIVTEDPRPPVGPREPGDDEPREATFNQMGLSEISVTGLGDLPPSSVSFSSPPPNPKEPAYMDLVFSHSPLVGTDGSSMRVELNGVAVGSIPLNDSNAEPTKVRIKLPHVALKPGRNALTFRFTIRTVGTLECGPVDASRAWAVIHPTSLIHLPPTGPKPPLNLGFFSYPLLRSGPLLENAYLETSILVLPSNRASWRDALQVALGLGRQATTDAVTQPAMLDQQLDEHLKTRNNLILYGAWGSNTLVEEANSLLPLQFVEETGKTISKQRERLVGVIEQLPVGVVELAPSPWNKDLSVVVLSGTDPETLSWATAALIDGGLEGNLATVVEENRISWFEIPFDEATIPIKGVRIGLPMVGTVSVSLLVVGVLALILVEPRLKSGKEKKKERGNG